MAACTRGGPHQYAGKRGGRPRPLPLCAAMAGWAARWYASRRLPAFRERKGGGCAELGWDESCAVGPRTLSCFTTATTGSLTGTAWLASAATAAAAPPRLVAAATAPVTVAVAGRAANVCPLPGGGHSGLAGQVDGLDRMRRCPGSTHHWTL